MHAFQANAIHWKARKGCGVTPGARHATRIRQRELNQLSATGQFLIRVSGKRSCKHMFAVIAVDCVFSVTPTLVCSSAQQTLLLSDARILILAELSAEEFNPKYQDAPCL